MGDWIAPPTPSLGSRVFAVCDRVVRTIEPFFPAKRRRRAIEKAVGFVTERLNGEDGLGAIFPPIANTVMMFDCRGYPADHPDCATAPGRNPQAARRRRRAPLLPALPVPGLGYDARLPRADGGRR